MTRSLLAVALAYALLLQGSLLPTQASARLAMASELPAGVLTLCSGEQVLGDDTQDPPAHHLSAQSSCCAWTLSVGLDPFAPPTTPATGVVYRTERSARLVGAFEKLREPPFRAVTAQGSRAPPLLAA
ncbi:hypothetical protein [Bosea sp. ANAM02]|uniref:hypothetical protein n=1 Tax=Bosea sp. ANAM02 TaxID=2020412 RepID=UPI00140EAED1|nr:hypothetical protein [Bosea sp. ANAM02]BCB17145.1 hypothetical protein OCUBac02_00390 [Bosea sp. ANAM02]